MFIFHLTALLYFIVCNCKFVLTFRVSSECKTRWRCCAHPISPVVTNHFPLQANLSLRYTKRFSKFLPLYYFRRFRELATKFVIAIYSFYVPGYQHSEVKQIVFFIRYKIKMLHS